MRKDARRGLALCDFLVRIACILELTHTILQYNLIYFCNRNGIQSLSNGTGLIRRGLPLVPDSISNDAWVLVMKWNCNGFCFPELFRFSGQNALYYSLLNVDLSVCSSIDLRQYVYPWEWLVKVREVIADKPPHASIQPSIFSPL